MDGAKKKKKKHNVDRSTHTNKCQYGWRSKYTNKQTNKQYTIEIIKKHEEKKRK